MSDETTGRAEGKTVFIAEHQGLYNAAFLIHEAAGDPSSVASMKNLRRIGCDALIKQIGHFIFQ